MRRCALVVVVALLAALPASAADRGGDAGSEPAPGRVVLARFATSYEHDAAHAARASNVALAAEAIHDKVLAPGATFSFNDAVGERTAAFGYARSVVLRDGMIAEGVGGGACQVASTLYAAALLGGLEIVARSPHSRPSAYIRMGLDATVALGGGAPIDLKLRNSGSTPVVVRARAARGVLVVSLDTLGGAPRPSVTLTSEILERVAPPRVVERDRHAPADTARVRAYGIPGYRVRRTREVRLGDGNTRRDVRVDVYPPTSEVVVAAPSLDESRIRTHGAANEPRPDLASDDPDAPPVTATADPGMARPALVQLRPSTLVTLTNEDAHL